MTQPTSHSPKRGTIYRACVPMILIFVVVTLLVTYVPWLTLVFVR